MCILLHLFDNALLDVSGTATQGVEEARAMPLGNAKLERGEIDIVSFLITYVNGGHEFLGSESRDSSPC